MRRRDATRRALRSHPSLAGYDAFRLLRGEVQAWIDDAKNKYLLVRLGSITSSARLWSELRSLSFARPKSSCSYSEISPNQLNSFFISVHLSSSSAPLSPINSPYFSSPSSLISSTPPPISDPSVFYFLHITPDVLRNALLTCSSNSTGTDSINRRLVMDGLPVVFTIILDLLNFSLNSSTFPSAWKLFHVIPLSITKNPSSPSDYRPISILCYLSKVLECIVYD